ncbi:MAG: DUF975 family protein [Candidatus Izimaplasma sp.]|nr:DUF975 family protein [Candidatus Izimaplasma bacterium]
MKKSYLEIKLRAKKRMRGKFSDPFVIVIVGGGIYTIINSFLARFYPRLPQDYIFIISPIVGLITSVLGMYIVKARLIPYLYGKVGVKFKELFKFEEDLKHFFVFPVLKKILYFSAGLIVTLPLYPLMNNLRNATSDVEMESIITNFLEQDLSLFIQNGLLYLALSLFIALILVKFTLFPYIVIDQQVSWKQALKKSWHYTAGNYFRVLFFPFAFLGWFLLGIITCGLGFFYAIPYYEVSRGYLYLSIKEEKGDGGELVFDTDTDQVITNSEDDPLASFNSEF